MGRPLTDVIIIDNSPMSFLFQPENALPCSSWYDDKSDRELGEFVPVLEKLAQVKDVRPYIKQMVEDNKLNFAKARELLGLNKPLNPEEAQVFTPEKQSHKGSRA